MKRLIYLIITLLLAVAPAWAKYTIYNVNGDVKLRTGSTQKPVTRGMEVKSSDELIIGKGATVEILNSATSKIFTSTRSGCFTVTRVLIDAQKQADKKTDAMNQRLTAASGKNKRTRYESAGAVHNTSITPEMLQWEQIASVITQSLADCTDTDAAAPAPTLPYTLDPEAGTITNSGTELIHVSVVSILTGPEPIFGQSVLTDAQASVALAPAESVTFTRPQGESMVIVSAFPFDMQYVTDAVTRNLTSGTSGLSVPAEMAGKVAIQILDF